MIQCTGKFFMYFKEIHCSEVLSYLVLFSEFMYFSREEMYLPILVLPDTSVILQMLWGREQK